VIFEPEIRHNVEADNGPQFIAHSAIGYVTPADMPAGRQAGGEPGTWGRNLGTTEPGEPGDGNLGTGTWGQTDRFLSPRAVAAICAEAENLLNVGRCGLEFALFAEQPKIGAAVGVTREDLAASIATLRDMMRDVDRNDASEASRIDAVPEGQKGSRGKPGRKRSVWKL
jgi:hypothetical protein